MSDIIHTIRLVTSAAAAITEVQKYEGAIVGATQTIERHANTLSGGKVLKNANEWTAAVARLGGATSTLATNEQLLAGASKLTATEKTRLNATITEAVNKYKALGQTAPSAMLNLQQATAGASQSTGLLAGGLKLIGPLFAGMALKTVVTDFVSTTSAIADMSAKTGIGTTQLQRLKFAAEQTGGSLDTVTGAVTQMSNRLVEGDKSAVESLKALNLNIQTLRAMDPGSAFETIATAIAEIPDPMMRTKVAMDLFGKSGAEVLPMITAGVKTLGDEAERTNQVMGEDMVKAGDQLGDTWDKLIGAGKNLVGGVLAPLVPLLVPIAEGIAYIGTESGKLLSTWLKLNVTDPFETTKNEIVNLMQWWGALRNELSIPLFDKPAAGFKAITDAARARAAVSVPLQMALDAEKDIIDQANDSLRENTQAAAAAAAAVKKFQDSVTTLGTLAYNWTTGLAPAVTSSFNFISLAGIEAIEVLEGVNTQFGVLPGRALGTEQALYGVAGAMDMVAKMTKTIPVAMADVTKPSAWKQIVTSFQGALEQLPGVIANAIQGGGSVGAAAGNFVGAHIGTTISNMVGKTLNNVLGKTIGSMLGATIPIVGGMLGQMLGPLIDKVWGKIKSIFGGPSAAELAGREIAAEFRENIISMMTEAQKLKAQTLINQGANATWAQSMVTVQDAYIAAGLTAEQALADMDALWKAEAQGADAVRAAMVPINAALEEAKKRSAAATDEIEDGAQDDAVPALDDMSVAAEAVGMSVEEVRAAVERMDAALKDNISAWVDWRTTVEDAAKAAADALDDVRPPPVIAPIGPTGEAARTASLTQGLPPELVGRTTFPPPAAPREATPTLTSIQGDTHYHTNIAGQEVSTSPQTKKLQAEFLASLERDGAFRTKVKQQLNLGTR